MFVPTHIVPTPIYTHTNGNTALYVNNPLIDNGLNYPIKCHRVAGWIKKENPSICCKEETYINSQDKCKVRVKGWKAVIQANGRQKSWADKLIS